jgi:hypothetical protein
LAGFEGWGRNLPGDETGQDDCEVVAYED